MGCDAGAMRPACADPHETAEATAAARGALATPHADVERARGFDAVVVRPEHGAGVILELDQRTATVRAFAAHRADDHARLRLRPIRMGRAQHPLAPRPGRG